MVPLSTLPLSMPLLFALAAAPPASGPPASGPAPRATQAVSHAGDTSLYDLFRGKRYDVRPCFFRHPLSAYCDAPRGAPRGAMPYPRTGY
jgi:hypothetical protein